MRTWFAIARVSAASVRPVLVVLVSRLFGETPANHFALVIVAGSVGMVLSAFDSGSIYVRTIPPPSPARTLRMIRFVKRWLVLAAFGAVGTAVAALTLGLGWILGAIAATYFVSERFAEDRQRHLLFDNETDLWSVLQIRRSSTQLTLVAGLSAIAKARGWADPACVVACTIALTAGNLTLISPSTTGRWLRRLFLSRRIRRELRSGTWTDLWRHRAIALAGISGSVITYCDRLSIGFLAPKDAALLLSAQSAVSIQQVAWNLLEFTPRRHEIIRGIGGGAIFKERRSIVRFTFCSALSILGLIAVAATISTGLDKKLAAIGLLLASGTVSAITMVPRETAFFGSQHSTVSRIEGLSALCMATLLMSCKVLAISIVPYLVTQILLKIVRLRALQTAAR